MKGARTPEQALSKRVFNSEHRLTVASALLQANGLVSQEDVQKATGVPNSSCFNELALLVELGVAQKVPAGRSFSYQPIEGPFWEWLRQLMASVASPLDPTQSVQTDASEKPPTK
ncbi:MAG: hypothetical protein JWO62_2277 [Acidimicrobiaceae bacterium]|nr:hypothetical protein [Acidimicrobiaceae bacterium]